MSPSLVHSGFIGSSFVLNVRMDRSFGSATAFLFEVAGFASSDYFNYSIDFNFKIQNKRHPLMASAGSADPPLSLSCRETEASLHGFAQTFLARV